MLVATQLVGFGAGGAGRATIAFADTVVNAANQTQYIFSGRNFGGPGSNRKIVVAASGGVGSGATDINSIVIGGVTGTQVVNHSPSFEAAALFEAKAPGTSGDVVVTFAQQQLRCGIGIWALYDAGEVADTFTTTTTGNQVHNNALSIPKYGVAIGYAINVNDSGPNMIVEVPSGGTADFDDAIESPVCHGGDHYAAPAAESIAIRMNSGSTVRMVGVAAAWGPLL